MEHTEKVDLTSLTNEEAAAVLMNLTDMDVIIVKK